MIGLSLSFCVKDILRGKVAVEDVSVIFSVTAFNDAAHFAEVVEQYCTSYWSSDPERARAIAMHLREYGKIVKPHEGDDPYDKPQWLRDLHSEGFSWLTPTRL